MKKSRFEIQKPEFITKLKKLKRQIDQDSNDNLVVKSSPNHSIDATIRQILEANNWNDLFDIENMNLEESNLLSTISTYLLAVLCSIYKIDGKKIEYIDTPSSNNREATLSTLALIGSPYFPLIFTSSKNKYEKKDYNEDIETDSQEETTPDKTNDGKIKYPLNVAIRKNVHFKCIKSLKPLGCSIQKYILKCPHTWTLYLPTNVNKRNGDIDKRYKYKKDFGFEEYKKNQDEYYVTYDEAVDLSLEKRFSPPLAFKKRYIKALLTLGGPFILEWIQHQDIRYKNKNIDEIKNAQFFFIKVYNETYKRLLEENDDLLSCVFNLFALETILNGSFLFCFCNFFSEPGKRHLLNNLKNNYPKSEPIHLLGDLYLSMNKIHNPFLKCWLVDNIINLFYQKNIHCKRNHITLEKLILNLGIKIFASIVMKLLSGREKYIHKSYQPYINIIPM